MIARGLLGKALLLSVVLAGCGDRTAATSASASAGAGGDGGASATAGNTGTAGSAATSGGGAGIGGSGGGSKGGAPGGGASGASGGGDTAGMSGSAGSTASGPKFCDLPTPGPAGVTAPPGFCVRAFAGDAVTSVSLHEPRVIRFSPSGDVFVSSPSSGTPGGNVGGYGLGAIAVLPDDNHDGIADSVVLYAGGPDKSKTGSCMQIEPAEDDLSCVHGLVFADGFLYFTRRNEVRRFPHKAGDRKAPAGAGDLVALLGVQDNVGPIRWPHTLERAPDGTIWVTRGQSEASCGDAEAPHRGAVLSINAATLPAAAVTVADGFRNPMFVRCRADGKCFANELTGDIWENGGREKLALVVAGSRWGYPCCYTAGMPVAGDPAACSGVSGEVVSFGLHSTPFGLDFEPGRWPAPYRGNVFVAMHGSSGSWVGTKVARVEVDASGLPFGSAIDFATGWGMDPLGGVVGRATDVAFAPDGRLFVVDDNSGGIWWIAPVDLPLPAGW